MENTPDAVAQRRKAARGPCPPNSIVRVGTWDEGHESSLELHCGGWLDFCDENHDRYGSGVAEPQRPHLIFEFEERGQFEYVPETHTYPLDQSEAAQVWNVARGQDWRTWASCSGDDGVPGWSALIDDGDMGYVSVRCHGHLPHPWRRVVDSLNALESFRERDAGDYLDYDRAADSGSTPEPTDSIDGSSLPLADGPRVRELDEEIARLEHVAMGLEGDPDQLAFLLKLAGAFGCKAAYFAGLAEQEAAYGRLATASRVRAMRVLSAAINDRRVLGVAGAGTALDEFAGEVADLGEDQLASAVYRYLCVYHEGPRISAACLYVADRRFDEGEFRWAGHLYELIVESDDEALHAHALVRAAVSLAQLPADESDDGHDRQSLRYFVEGIEATQDSARVRSDEEARELRRLARLGLVEPLARVGSPAEAVALIDLVGRGPGADQDETREMLERLAEAYAGLGKKEESAAIHEVLRERD